MKLSPGFISDFAVGYRIWPWLTVEAELGYTINAVDSVGDWSYPASSLGQLLIMGNVMAEYPLGHFVPFAGVGGGGDYSSLSFGNYYDYYWSTSDGYGTDFVPAFQAIAGLRYEFDKTWSLGVTYRFMATDRQNWNVDWWSGGSFRIGVDSVRMHAVCLVFTGSF